MIAEIIVVIVAVALCGYFEYRADQKKRGGK